MNQQLTVDTLLLIASQEDLEAYRLSILDVSIPVLVPLVGYSGLKVTLDRCLDQALPNNTATRSFFSSANINQWLEPKKFLSLQSLFTVPW